MADFGGVNSRRVVRQTDKTVHKENRHLRGLKAALTRFDESLGQAQFSLEQADRATVEATKNIAELVQATTMLLNIHNPIQQKPEKIASAAETRIGRIRAFAETELKSDRNGEKDVDRAWKGINRVKHDIGKLGVDTKRLRVPFEGTMHVLEGADKELAHRIILADHLIDRFRTWADEWEKDHQYAYEFTKRFERIDEDREADAEKIIKLCDSAIRVAHFLRQPIRHTSEAPKWEAQARILNAHVREIHNELLADKRISAAMHVIMARFLTRRILDHSRAFELERIIQEMIRAQLAVEEQLRRNLAA